MELYWELYEMGWHRRQEALALASAADLREALVLAREVATVSSNLGTEALVRELARTLESR